MESAVRHAGPAPAGDQSSPSPPVADGPAAAIVAAANGVHHVTDSRNRVLGFRRLNTLERARMFQILGPDDSRNDAYMSFALAAFWTVEVDGNPLPLLTLQPNSPTIRVQLEGRISLLGDEGIEAVNQGIAEHFGMDLADDGTKAVKN